MTQPHMRMTQPHMRMTMFLGHNTRNRAKLVPAHTRMSPLIRVHMCTHLLVRVSAESYEKMLYLDIPYAYIPPIRVGPTHTRMTRDQISTMGQGAYQTRMPMGMLCHNITRFRDRTRIC